jgi:two-component system chemotaxis response regulator CheB
MMHPTNAASALKALVVDDDAAYRRILTLSLQRVGLTQISVAGDLTLARSKLEREAIDLVTIDIVMRGESGLELLQWMRQHHPDIATILVTSGSEAAACRSVDALLLGATALVLKPSGPNASSQLDDSLNRVISGLSVTRPVRTATPGAVKLSATPLLRAHRELIAIGASTGGPPVVLKFLESLPHPLTTPIVITQHMPELHMHHFATLLRERTGLAVAIAEDGEPVLPAHVYVAPGGMHLQVARADRKLVLRHDRGPEEHNCRPAVDPMFRSVAQTCGAAVIGVVMTGMGSDGALGAVALRERGAAIVIQDRNSSVVWGMPGAVAAKGAADVISPGDSLADWVASLDSGMTPTRRML